MKQVYGQFRPEPGHDRWTNRRDLLGATTALVAIVAVALSFINWYRVADTNTRAVQTRHVQCQLRTTIRLLTEAETGQRGFLLTGREDYLTPYKEAVGNCSRLWRRLQTSPELQPYQRDVASLIRATQTKLFELKETLEVRRKSGFEAALRIVETDEGRVAMDQAKAILARLESSALRDVDALAKRVADRARDAAVINHCSFGNAVHFVLPWPECNCVGSSRSPRLPTAPKAPSSRV